MFNFKIKLRKKNSILNKSKLIKIINLYFINNDLIKYYKNQFLKLNNFVKKKFNFITHNQIFYFFSLCNLSDLKIIVYIIKKKFKIKIIDSLPNNELYSIKNYNLNNNYKKILKKKKINKIKKKNFFKKLYFNKINNLKLYYKNIKKIDFKIINKYLNKILKTLTNNPIIFKYISKFFKKKINISSRLKKKIYNINKNYYKKSIFNFNYLEIDENNDFINLKKKKVSKNLIKSIFENNLINRLKQKNKIILSKKYKIKILNKIKIKDDLEYELNYYKYRLENINELYYNLTSSIKNFKRKFFFIINNLLNFFLKNKLNKYKKKKNYIVLIKNIIKNKLKKFNINLDILNDIFIILLKYIKKIEKIKNKIYDIVSNVSNISPTKFLFLFINNGSNLNWLYKIINNKNLSNLFINKYNNVIKKREEELKEIELKLFIPIKKFLKIFLEIENNKLKIDIIKNNLIHSNLNLVNYICKKYSNKELYLDYIQEGNIGLINAINTYRYNLNINFKDYIIICIKRNISKFIYKKSRLVRLPDYIITLIRKINKIYKNYWYKYNEKPTVKYISDKINISQKRVKNILNFYKDILSSNQIIDDNTKLEDLIKDEKIKTPEEILFKVELKKFSDNLLSKLDARDVEILCMRYGINFKKRHTLSQIGVKHNISRERVRQVQNIILDKLRHPMRSKKLKKFFTPKNKIL